MADNINLSPDMIENLVNMLKNNNTETNSDSETASSTSNCNSSSNSSNSSNSSSLGNLDFETIMKMKSIMETFNNSNDQDSNLLYSLKPYLRKSRQAKLDQYINILKISQVSKLFNKGENL